MERFIPAADFLAALPEIAVEGGIRALAERIAASGHMQFAAAERRLGALVRGEQATIGSALADRILTALDLPHAFDELARDYVPPSKVVCEDCAGEIEPDVMPIDLFRPVPEALEGRTWDKTKGRWVRRPGRARAGGRRFRLWHLCRFCRAEALRQRSIKSGGHLKTRDRIPPKRGGRPRLLNEVELRAAYRVYVETGLSRREIARRLLERRGNGSLQGYEQSLLYGWRRLGFKTRTLAHQIAISRHGADVDWEPRASRRCKKKLRNGRRCALGVWRKGEGELCWNHAMQERRNHDRCADATLEVPA